MEQNISESTSLQVYSSLQEISALLFHDIKFSGNILKLDKDFKEDKVYEDVDIIQINETWLKLYDEYFEKTDDPRFRKELKNKKESFRLLCAITKGKEFLDLLEFVAENEEYIPNETHLEVVTTLGQGLKKLAREYHFDIEKPLKENLNHNRNVLGGLQTRYELQFKKDLNVEKKDITLFYEIKAQIEQVLQKDYIPDYINMLQWIAYEKHYKKRISGRQFNSRQGTSRRNH